MMFVLQAFCRFDDYNWDWSLNYIGVSCTQNKFRVMIMKSPRVFHIGEWCDLFPQQIFSLL